MEQVLIDDKQGTPITHVDAVRNDNGNTIDSSSIMNSLRVYWKRYICKRLN